jgi:hypothetical protein
MENEHPYPPCHCGASEFISLPEVALEIHRSTTAFGLQAAQRIGHVRMTLVICKACGKTDTFTTNAQELAGRVPGAVAFRGVTPG